MSLDRTNVRFPAPLASGASIVVVAPSSPVAPALYPRLELVLDELRARGYVPRESPCLRASETRAASIRLEAWMDALLDDTVDAVMPPWGGELAIELLDGMDFERLRGAKPKWILGYSDISTLLVPLLLELAWASAHGPNLMDLVPAQRDPLSSRTLVPLTGEEPFAQRSSTHFQTAWVDWTRSPGAPFQLDQPTTLRTLDGGPVHARGRLIGGCIDTIMHLVGTRFGDVPGFVRRNRDTGVMLFLENCELAPGQLARALTQMRLAGWLDDVRAVMFGRSAAKGTTSRTQENVVRSVLGDLRLPVVLDADIGHLPPQWTLIEGAFAMLDVEEGVARIVQQQGP